MVSGINVMIKRILAFAAVPLLALAWAAESRAETLAEALEKAYLKSDLLEQNRALLRAADEDVGQQRAALRPILKFVSTAGGQSPTAPGQDDDIARSQALQISWQLYDFGANAAAADAMRATVLATRQSLLDVEQRVLLNAVSAYVETRGMERIVQLSQNNVRLITRELGAARDRFQVGEITRTDVSLARSRLAAARSTLVTAEGDLSDARARYVRWIGDLPETLSAPPEAPATAASIEDATAVAMRRHPVVLEARHQSEAADLGAKAAKRRMRPTISLNGSFTQFDRRQGPANSDIQRQLSVTLDATIYQGGARLAGFRGAFARADSAKARLHSSTRDVRQRVRNAWTAVSVAEASIVAANEQIDAAEVAFRGVRQEAALGARTTLDVLNAELELLNARTGLVRSEIRAQVARYDLLSQMGLLTVEHLGLSVPIYDPTTYYDYFDSAPPVFLGGANLDRVLRAIGKE